MELSALAVLPGRKEIVIVGMHYVCVYVRAGGWLYSHGHQYFTNEAIFPVYYESMILFECGSMTPTYKEKSQVPSLHVLSSLFSLVWKMKEEKTNFSPGW